MFNEIHSFLSSTAHTGYQTIFIGIVTTIITSIVIFNINMIGKVLKYSAMKILGIIKIIISRFRKYIDYKKRERAGTLTAEELLLMIDPKDIENTETEDTV